MAGGTDARRDLPGVQTDVDSYYVVILLGLSIIKAALIVAYFMHLKFERLSLILTIIPMLVVCILLLFVFFPDSFRSAGLRYQFKEAPPVAPPAVEEQ